MSVNSEMTAIADLIRGLRGVSGKMGLDAMKGHLQDEQDGLDSALAALTEKGVTVPAGTKVDGLAALIAAIEAGGGGASIGDWTIQSGTFTPSENITSDYIIDLDEVLDTSSSVGRYIVAFWLDNPPGVDESKSAWVCSIKFFNIFSQTGGASSSVYGAYTDTDGSVATQTKSSLCIAAYKYNLKIPCTTSKMLMAGNVYRWIILSRKWQ